MKDERVDVTLRVNPGPVVDLAFEGIPASKGLVKRAETIWQRGVFDSQRADAVKDEIRQRLIKDRYLDPKVEYAIEQADPSRRRIVFRAEPGVRFDQVRMVFDGAQGIGPKELESIIKEQKLGPRVFTEPAEVVDLLKRVYREQGYLTAEVEKPEHEFDRESAFRPCDSAGAGRPSLPRAKHYLQRQSRLPIRRAAEGHAIQRRRSLLSGGDGAGADQTASALLVPRLQRRAANDHAVARSHDRCGRRHIRGDGRSTQR